MLLKINHDEEVSCRHYLFLRILLFRVSPGCIQDRTTCMYPKYPQPWIQFKEFSSACEKFIKFSHFAGKTIACLQTLYFLFEVRRARGIKNKNRGGFVDSQRKGAGLEEEENTFLCRPSPLLMFLKRTERKLKQAMETRKFARS